MGLFNMLEMFFFVSLAITFVLILFLVYHFRQKMTSMENRCDAMFEIINNIVKELNNRNNLVAHSGIPENVLFKPDISYFEQQEMSKLVVSDNEYEAEDEADESDEEDDESDEEEDESDEEDDNVILPEIIDDESSVKVINMEIREIDSEIVANDENQTDNIDEEDPDIHNGLDTESVNNIHVEKLETTLENVVNDAPIVDMDVYRKMNLNALKALVIEKGYASDTTKMKKVDLLKLLESSA
jgi:hypothetical protein